MYPINKKSRTMIFVLISASTLDHCPAANAGRHGEREGHPRPDAACLDFVDGCRIFSIGPNIILFMVERGVNKPRSAVCYGHSENSVDSLCRYMDPFVQDMLIKTRGKLNWPGLGVHNAV